ncbi:MAG: cytosol nonspecific dipeptidase [Bacteroidetes bacterium]|nr:MAG: cytosol nonspecific dipeptidase [Bacteroidota bacterium]PIE87778.1 MAG: cytosol nonspecific dipeptidase [Bacteroidota bacterium]
MNYVLKELKPSLVWKYFEDICQVPRPSKKEEKIRAFLVDFAKAHNLSYEMDDIGNVIIRKPATPGMEKKKSVVLQSHMDMVCEKNADKVHDFDHDPIEPIIDGEWVRANQTTLGADDGIGVATELAILTDPDIQHGPIECLFTVDEETGLTGAFELAPGFIKSKILLNLDSEDEGELFIGCAGGVDTLATFETKYNGRPVNHLAYSLSVTGLKGGHSGDEIHKGLGNSIKILNRFLWNCHQKYKIRIAHFEGGNLRNAIPREAFATITIRPKDVPEFERYFEEFKAEAVKDLSLVEPGFTMAMEKVEKPGQVIDRGTQHRLLNALYACPHGVIAMSQSMKGMVETSTNLASVKFLDDNRILVTTSQRSDATFGKYDVASMVESVFTLAGAEVTHTDGYPGWKPNPNSEIKDITVAAYEKLFGETPIVRSIHAGLECGLILEKYPDMDMISYGPTLRMVHSPEEKIHIGTVAKFWDLTKEVLLTIPEA